MEIKKISFPMRQNETGSLTFLEAQHDVPFDIKRIYYIHDVASGARRGAHAHKALQQVYICIHGTCKVLLDNGKERTTVELNQPSEGLVFEDLVWREIFDFSPSSVLLVLASDFYDESDYIRNYQDFLSYIGGCES